MTLIKSTRNQIRNVSTNTCQGKDLKVLCVCSAGILRSKTLANVLYENLGCNTLSVGTAKDFCLVPISEATVAWCDIVVFVDRDCQDYLTQEDWEFINEWDVGVITLDVPDNYDYGDEELKRILFEQYCHSEIKSK